MEEFLRGECSIFSAPLSVSLSHDNPVLPVGNAKSNTIIVSSLVINEEQIVGGSNELDVSVADVRNDAGLPVEVTVQVDAGVVSRPGPSSVIGDNVLLGCGEVVVELSLVRLGSSKPVALDPVGPVISDTEIVDVDGVNEDFCNPVGSDVFGGPKEGICNNMGDMSPIPCLVNHVSINGDVDDDVEEDYCSDSLKPCSLAQNSIVDNSQDVVVILDSSPLGPDVVCPVVSLGGLVENLNVGVPCDALALKGVEDSIGALHDGTVVEDAISPSVNLPLPTAVVDIPISVVSNAELKAHLALSVSNSSLDHPDWLNGSDVDVGELANDFQDFQDMYNFMANHIVDHAFSSGADKRGKSKPKKK
ncbi:hypothetical protein IEQ34_000675 [Dendrobium chrysotoxum]|uniref:Uncharacterized protein n=1 Tax=Dendrobium chrysotoxum TaxID=161865 RepID=A0AAV7HQ93_DENCH|nr:hypothetical protein IEQ34_000675 [Dendrobium chrysotoxum]